MSPFHNLAIQIQTCFFCSACFSHKSLLLALVFQIRPDRLHQCLRWLIVHNPTYANIQVVDNLADLNLSSTADDADAVPNDIAVNLTSSSATSSTSSRDPSEAASSNHANAQREDDDIMRHLPKDQHGFVHIQQMSSFVSESPNPTRARDGLLAEHEQLTNFLVSDAHRWGDEFDKWAWVKAFPLLFAFGRYVVELLQISSN
jgi:hypothetical protein